MITPEELKERLAELKDIQDQIYAIYYNDDPFLKFKMSNEIKLLEKHLHDKFTELSTLCDEKDKTYFYEEYERARTTPTS